MRSDAYSYRRARGAAGLLAQFNEAGVIAAADVHVARRLCDVLGEADEDVRLAMALAVRAPRLGHVHVDLATIRETVAVEPAFGDDEAEPVDVTALPWPDGDWAGRVGISRMVSDGPLRLEGSALYLDRYWRDECAVADDLHRLTGPAEVDESLLADGIERLFRDDKGGDQASAAGTVIRNRLAIVAGGPGTGKTTAVARILALLFEQSPDRPPLVALAAPTGKAQSRLEEAIAEEAGRLDVAPEVRERILGLQASTIHRLLGSRFDNRTRFRHHRGEKLPHDVVIVDETSMVSLSLMARLIEAIRPGARLVLVGDPGQLASVEAGAVLGDIVGAEVPGIARLTYVHRHAEGGAIARLGKAISEGQADAAMEILTAGGPDVEWVGEDDTALRAPALAAARAVRAAAADGDPDAALLALRGFRVLCAHRREVAAWTDRLEAALRIDSRERFYVGRPLLVTSNDYDLGLFNGESGVIVARPDDRREAVFERGTRVSPGRLAAVDTSYAMTIHKAQGSQFRTAAVVLPDAESRLLTRELLYTACTRAQDKLLIAGTEDAITQAIRRPIARASGLRDRLSSSRETPRGE